MGLMDTLSGANIPQLAYAGGQMIAGAINRKKADSALPQSENPMERQMLNTIRRRRQALQTGTAGSADRAAMRQMAKGLQTGSMRAGGPVNFGQYNQLMSNAAQNLAAANGQQLSQVLGMEQKQTGDMANLANDIALLRSNRLSAQAENQMKSGTQNMLASIGASTMNEDGTYTNPSDQLKKKKGIGADLAKGQISGEILPQVLGNGAKLMSVMAL